MERSEILKQTIDALHRQYGEVVTADQVTEWLHANGFEEKPVGPEPRFKDEPKTRFVKEGHALEYRVIKTSNVPPSQDGNEFAVLLAYAKGYYAHMPLN